MGAKMILTGRIAAGAAALALTVAIQGCVAENTSFGDSMTGLQVPPPTEFHADDELLPVAKTYFKEGNYGYAQHYYHRAVQVTPDDAEAWLGLAASYDRIRRFELADQAYRRAEPLIGHRPEFHNNVGYSYLLRGNLLQARRHFLKAYELAPSDPTIVNNLELLHDSVTTSRRGRSVARSG